MRTSPRGAQVRSAAVNLPSRPEAPDSADAVRPDLAISRATSRGSSFCQFVVHDDAPFEVNDARADGRAPTELVEEYGIRA